jgi:hypothetical protein
VLPIISTVGVVEIDLTGNRYANVPMLGFGLVILLIGVAIARAKHAVAQLIGLVIGVVGLYAMLQAIYITSGLFALTASLIALLIGLFSLIGAKSIIVKIVAGVAAVFVILTLANIFGGFPPGTFLGDLFETFKNNSQSLWNTIFH